MANYQVLVDAIMEMVEVKIMGEIVLPRIRLEVVDPDSAEGQADEVRRSMPPPRIESENPLLVARVEVMEAVAAWVDVIDKAWGDQSEEP